MGVVRFGIRDIHVLRGARPMCEAAAITLLGSLGLAWTPQGNRKRSTGNDKGWELVCLLIHREAESIDGDGNHVHSPQFCPKKGGHITESDE